MAEKILQTDISGSKIGYEKSLDDKFHIIFIDPDDGSDGCNVYLDSPQLALLIVQLRQEGKFK